MLAKNYKNHEACQSATHPEHKFAIFIGGGCPWFERSGSGRRGRQNEMYVN